MNHTQRIAEALEVDDLAFSEEADRIGDVAVVAEAKDIVIGLACLLLCRKVFREVCYRVAGGLEGVRVPRHTACRNGIESGRVVNKVRVEAALFNLLEREVARKLINNRAYHFHVRQLLGSYLML